MDARIPYEACPLCEGREMDEVATAVTTGYPLYKPGLPATQRWVRCRACSHVFTDGYFTKEALALLFSQSHAGQTPGEDIETARYVWAKTVERVSAMRPGLGGRWLDVGFGNGALLATADELGWEVAGIDLREDNVRAMRDLGFSVHAIELTSYHTTAPFDVISMADVLEHMPFPKAALQHAWGLLRDGGLLLLSMPNSDSLLWETLTKNGVNPYFAEMEHYHNFGRKRLFELLEECHFAPKQIGVSVRYRACIEVVAQKVRRPARSPKVDSAAAKGELRLNLGCGRSPIEGWVNLDSMKGPGVDVVADLETVPLPFEDDSVAEINGSHVLEHIKGSLALMQELHRIAKPGARAVFRVPYGSSDDADEDPTHLCRYYWGSWGYFSQPHYWRADYGYRGDWDLEEIVLVVDPSLEGKSWEESFRAIQERRNVVREMVATLRAVKPIREPRKELQKNTLIKFVVGEKR